ncbi:MAG TPA: hypothetical protein VIU64_15370 [Polyangia bacterium]
MRLEYEFIALLGACQLRMGQRRRWRGADLATSRGSHPVLERSKL